MPLIDIDTDVLVIGSGFAGFFAALKAKEQGLDVTLIDKAYVGKAGSTHFSEGDTVYFRPDQGHNLKEWLDKISQTCEYVNNREWDEICLNESEARYNDLVSWGVPFYEKDGKVLVFTMMGARTPYKDVTMRAGKVAPILRKRAISSGIRVLDHIMMSELLKQDGRIVGCMGFHTISGRIFIINAGATIIATGSSSMKAGAYPVYFWTGDGEAMAYRAGAEIGSKEFMYGSPPLRADVLEAQKNIQGNGIVGDIVTNAFKYPFAIGGGFTGWFNSPTLNAEGGRVITSAWEAHCGRAPLYFELESWPPERLEWLREYFKRIELANQQSTKIDLDVFQGGKIKWPASRVMTNSIFAGSGIWPIDKGCATAVPGLYTAGNSCATMTSGAAYAGGGSGSNHAMVTGTHAALAAVDYIRKFKKIDPHQEELNRALEVVSGPFKRQGGFSPSWVTQVIQSVTVPYFYLHIKHAERLKAALTIIDFVNNHMVPLIKAENPHELRLAHETRNMALIAEMRIKASLFRTESRGNHFREDYPRRDDPNWLAWVKLKNTHGNMELIKEPIPEKWWPDLSTPYETRYPRILPLE
jgi:succinate dehydrogenase/fumarate reductase flavoprotein subunit